MSMTAIIEPLALVEEKPMCWIWPNRLPAGKFCLVAGDPSVGKSTMCIDMMARVTRGAEWPDGSGRVPTGSVLFIGCEDDLADTVKPRLRAAGAVIDRTFALSGIRASAHGRMLPFCLDHVRWLEPVIIENGVRLVVIDPLAAYFGRVDSHNTSAVRGALTPVQELAAKTGACIVGIAHWNKGTMSGASAMYRVGGSLATVAAARAAHAVGLDPSDPQRRIFVKIKNNLSPDPGGLAYRIVAPDGVACVEWETGRVDMTADQLVSPQPDGGGKVSEAKEFLREHLADGPKLARVMFEAAQVEGISETTLKRAKKVVGVAGWQEAEGWMWSLPQSGE